MLRRKGPDLHCRDAQTLFFLFRKETFDQFHPPAGVMGVAIRTDVMSVLLVHRRTPDHHLNPVTQSRTCQRLDHQLHLGKAPFDAPGILPMPQDQANQTSLPTSVRQLLRNPLTLLCVPTAWVRAVAEVMSA